MSRFEAPRDPDQDRDPDEDPDEEPPSGRITPTGVGQLVGFGVAGLVIGWAVR